MSIYAMSSQRAHSAYRVNQRYYEIRTHDVTTIVFSYFMMIKLPTDSEL